MHQRQNVDVHSDTLLYVSPFEQLTCSHRWAHVAGFQPKIGILESVQDTQ